MARESCCCRDDSVPSRASLVVASSANSVTAAGRGRGASVLSGALSRSGVLRWPRPTAGRLAAGERTLAASLSACCRATDATSPKPPSDSPLPMSSTKLSPAPPPISRDHMGFIEVKLTTGECRECGENAAAPLLRTLPCLAIALSRSRLNASKPAQVKTSAALAITPPSGAGPSCCIPALMLAGFAAAECGEGSRGVPREVRPTLCSSAESGTPLAADSCTRKGHSELVAKPQHDDPDALLQSPIEVACVIASAAACERIAIS